MPPAVRSSAGTEGQISSGYPGTGAALVDEQYTLLPDVKTAEVHIIAGAIIPLWEKLKARETPSCAS